MAYWIDDLEQMKEQKRMTDIENLLEEIKSTPVITSLMKDVARKSYQEAIDKLTHKLISEIHFGYEVEQEILEIADQMKEQIEEKND